MSPWNDFHGYIEVFLLVHGNISVSHTVGYHFTQLNTFRISPFLLSFLGVIARVTKQ
jgi:hypothetical protein